MKVTFTLSNLTDDFYTQFLHGDLRHNNVKCKNAESLRVLDKPLTGEQAAAVHDEDQCFALLDDLDDLDDLEERRARWVAAGFYSGEG